MDTDDEDLGSSSYSDNECILYDILQLVEWPKEEEVCTASQNESEVGIVALGAKQVRSSMSRWTSNVARLVGMQAKTGSSCLLPCDLIELINGQGSWIFASSLDGNFLAVLQENCLEIRASKEDFSLLFGSFPFPRDPHPQWRKIAWSSDSSMIAFSESDGTVHVCDLKGILLFSIKGQEDTDSLFSDYSFAICGLVFFENEMSNDTLNLMIVSYNGLVTCIEVNDTYDMGYTVAFNFDIASTYPHGVSSVIYDKEHHILLVGGCFGNTVSSERIPTASKCGISAWRFLSDPPFLKMIDLNVKKAEFKKKFGVLRKLSTVPRDLGSILKKQQLDGIYTAVLSPSNKQLIAVHLNGSLSLWDVPSLRHRKTWKQLELPYFDEVNPEYTKNLSLSKRLSEYPFLQNIVDCNWWNDEAITLARFSGSLVIVKVSEDAVKNLLGEQCEWLHLAPRLSPTREGGFLVLECDTRIKALKRQRTVSEEEAKKESEDNDPFLDDSDNEAKPGLSGRLINQYKSMIYDLTEIDYFRPPRKKPKLVTKQYRLINLMKTTPEKLYKRKIEEEEYGEALSLARSYNLDCDKVFQRQWSKSPVSIASIQDYLRKVKKRSWVLHECCERVPMELDAARELLKFGLHFTDVDRIAYVQDASEASGESEDSDMEEYDGFDVQEQRRQEIKTRERFVNKWEKKIELENLTLEQKEMIRARRKILQYLDRLATYELLLGGYDAARERYIPERYAKFRQQNILLSAVEFAHAGDSKAVDILLTHHGNELREHRLPVLSNFPKTLLPSNYLDLLPEIGSDAKAVPWLEEYHRDTTDWCEDEKYNNMLHYFGASGDATEEFYQDYSELKQFRSDDVSGDLLRQWYMKQAVQMDSDACDIECALDILRIGQQRGVEGLDALIRDFCVLESLVYECEYDPGITLVQIQNKSKLEILHMLLANSSRDMYIKNIHRWAIPFLKSCNEEKDKQPAIEIFQDYIMDLAEEDITLPSLVLTSFISDRTLPDFMLEWDWLVNLCLNSVYVNERSDQLALMNRIHSCLVNIDKAILREKVPEAIGKINRLDKHIYACTMLAKYKVNVCPKFIKEVENDRQKVHKLLIRLSRTAGNRETPLTRAEWYALLTDMLQLRKQVFSSTCTIEAAICLEVFVESLLTSGSVTNFQIAGERIMRTATEELEASKQYSYSPLQKLSYETAVELVIKSSQEYFDASSPTSDNQMLSLARECLLLITDRPPRIQERLDLIEGVVLLRSFGIDKLPLQVRLMQDRSNLITKALEVNDRAYQKTESLLRLGMLLRVGGSNKEKRKGQILVKIVEKALHLKDFPFAFSLCQEMVHMPYEPAWTVCWKLALCDEFDDMFAKQNILAFAACFCDAEKLKDITEHLCLLNFLVLQEEIKVHERQDNLHGPTQEDDEMEHDPENPGVANEKIPVSSEVFFQRTFFSPSKMFLSTAKGTKAVLSATGNVLSATGTVLSATSSTTKAILSNVSDSQWWRSTISQSLNDQPNSESSDDYDLLHIQDFELQGCPSFYSSVIENSVSKYELNISLGTYNLPSTVSLNQAKLHCLRLGDRTNFADSNTLDDEISLLKDLIMITPYDFALGLSYCLAISDTQALQESFEKFPVSALSIQLVLFYYALRFLSTTKKNKFADLSLIFETDATKVIEKAVELASLGTYQPNEELQKVAKHLLQWNEQLLDFIQGEKLHQLGKGIDLNRFTKDFKYKEETILGLAMTSEEEQYILAESVARRSGMNMWSVLCTHLEYLFTECQDQVSTNNLKSRIEKLNMIPELIKNPTEFISRMDSCVYPFISGTDHERLILYFSLLNECKKKDVDVLSSHNLCPIAPLDHVKMLRKIKAMTPSLDYKMLVTDESKDNEDQQRILTLMRPHLDKSNVQMFSKMIPKIPYSGHRISASALYLQVIRDLVWKDLSSEETHLKSIPWQERYQSTVQFLRFLTPNDLVAFFLEFLFSDWSKIIPHQTRQEFAKQGVKTCKNQMAKEKKNELDVEILHEGQSFNLVLHELLNMSKHLNSYSTSFISNMVKQRNEDPIKDKYLKLYDESLSKPDPILDLAALMLCDGCLPSFVQQFLAAVHGNKWNVTNVLDRAILNTFKLFSDEETQNTKAFNQLTHLIDSVSSHENQGGKLLKSRQVIDLLRKTSTDCSVSMETHVKVLQLLEERFKLDGAEAGLLLFHRSQAVIKDGWGDDVCNSLLPAGSAIDDVAEVVATEEKRTSIFDRLLNVEDKTLVTLKHLITLLSMWPTMSDKTLRSRCFTDVLTSMVAFGSEGGKEILNVVKDSPSEIPADALSAVFNTLLESEFTFFAIKLALLTNVPQARETVVQAMQAVTSLGPSQCDEELILLLLKNKVAVKTIGTVYYPRIAEYLLSGDCIDAERHVHNLTRQLQEEGHVTEAGTLLLSLRGAHPAMRTFGNAMSSLARWLRS